MRGVVGCLVLVAACDRVGFESRTLDVAFARAPGQETPTAQLPIDLHVIFSAPVVASSFSPGDVGQQGDAVVDWQVSELDSRTFLLRATSATPGLLLPALADRAVEGVDGSRSIAVSAGPEAGVRYAPAGADCRATSECAGGYICDNSACTPAGPCACGDSDADGCDDCSITCGAPDPVNDGTDSDGDGYCDVNDCDDTDAAVHPDTLWYKDADGDLYSDGVTQTQCAQPAGYVLADGLTQTSGDCDDADAALSPGNTEGPAGDATCSDGFDNDCDTLTDTDDPDCPSSGGLPPLAKIEVAPWVGDSATAFAFDASGCTDDADPTNALEVRWDWESDGTWDTGWSTTKTASHAYSGTVATTVLEAAVEVRDTAGRAAIARTTVTIADTADTIIVDTHLDETSEPTTTSLREAIDLANGTPGPQIIVFDQTLVTQTLVLGSKLQAQADDPGGMLVGGDSISIDCASVPGGQNCATFDTPLHVIGIAMQNCAGDCIVSSATGGQIEQSTFYRPQGSRTCLSPGPGWTIGPRNLFDHCNVHGDDDVTFIESTFIGGGSYAPAARVAFIQNTFLDCDPTVTLEEIIRPQGPDQVIWNNTFHNCTLAAIHPYAAENLDVRNNLFSDLGAAAIWCEASLTANIFLALDSNGYSNVAGARCTGNGCATDANAVAAPAGFVDAANGDLRLAPTSDMIDAGADLGYDLNGPAPGSFFGSAPDIGANECNY